MNYSKALWLKFRNILLSKFNLEWNKQLKPTTLMYPAYGKELIDIKKVFNVHSDEEGEMISFVKSKKWNTFNNDISIMKICEYVNKLITYKNDIITYKQYEFWADPYTIWKKEFDDCDGFAVLICKLGWLSGIPKNRLKVCTGYAWNGIKFENHAYVLYLREQDNEWYTMEGSLYPKDAILNYLNFLPHRFNSDYKQINWSTTDEQSWSINGLTLE